MAVNLSTIQVKRKDPWAPLTRAVILGDSIDAGFASYSVLGLYKAEIPIVKNAGVGGATLEEMLARFATDVTANNPDLVIIKGGTNDVGRVGYSQSASIGFLNQIIANCHNIGAVPVVVLLPARDDSYNTASLELRQAILENCLSTGVTVLDPFKISINPETGLYLAGFSGDGIHPNGASANTIGMEFASLLQSSGLALRKGMTPTENKASGGISSNPLMYTANGYGGWAVGGPTSGSVEWTASIVDDADFRGKAQKVTASFTLERSFSFKFGPKIVGTYFYTFKLKINTITGGPSNLFDAYLWDVTPASGRYYVLQNALFNDGQVITVSGFYNSTTTSDLSVNFTAGLAGAWSIDFSFGEFQAWLV